MPSANQKQHNLMAMVANNPAKAKQMGISKSVGQEFMAADKGKKFGTGGPKSRADRQAINQPKTNHGESALFKKGGAMKKGYADGGMSMVNKGGKMVPDFAADGKGKMAKGGKAHEDVKMDKGMMQKAVNKHEGRLHKGQPMTKLAKGGAFRASANGVATKGKTKGTMVAMKHGGKAC